jgi:hypothetical protein
MTAMIACPVYKTSPQIRWSLYIDAKKIKVDELQRKNEIIKNLNINVQFQFVVKIWVNGISRKKFAIC